MSKPGGKPIVKKRPFFEDDHIAIFSLAEEGKFTAFEGTDKSKNVTKSFKVNAKQEIKKAAGYLPAYRWYPCKCVI